MALSRPDADVAAGRRMEQMSMADGMTQIRLIEMWVARRDRGRTCVDLRNISRMKRPPPPEPKACLTVH